MSPKVIAIFKRLSDVSPNCEYGHGHIVFADLNLEDSHIQFCLDEISSGKIKDHIWHQNAEEIEADRLALLELLTIPEAERIAGIDDEERRNHPA